MRKDQTLEKMSTPGEMSEQARVNRVFRSHISYGAHIPGGLLQDGNEDQQGFVAGFLRSAASYLRMAMAEPYCTSVPLVLSGTVLLIILIIMLT